MLVQYRPIMIAAIAALTWTTTMVNRPAQAQTTQFVCAQINGVYTTVAKRTTGRDRPVIHWVSSDFEQKGYTTEKRCLEVSNRFQSYHASGDLNYLTTGKMNGQPVICTTPQRFGACDKLLFTVRPGVNPQQTLRKLLAIRVKSSIGGLNESTAGPAEEEQLYVDMREILSGPTGELDVPTEATPSNPPNLTSVPSVPTSNQLVPNPSGSLW